MVQLGSADTLGSYLFTSETDYNKRLSNVYYKLKSDEPLQLFFGEGNAWVKHPILLP